MTAHFSRSDLFVSELHISQRRSRDPDNLSSSPWPSAVKVRLTNSLNQREVNKDVEDFIKSALGLRDKNSERKFVCKRRE